MRTEKEIKAELIRLKKEHEIKRKIHTACKATEGMMYALRWVLE